MIAKLFGEDAEQVDEKKMYQDALKKLNVTDQSTKEQIVNNVRTLRLAWHPDKNPSPDAKEKLLDYECAFTTIEGYRRAQGRW